MAATLAAFCAGAARADVLYSNGPANGEGDAWSITGNEVTDSFTLSAPATMTGFDLTVWVPAGDTLTSVSWAVGSTMFGTDLGSGSGTVTLVTGALNNYDDYVATYLLSGLDLALPGGTAWLTLSDATTANSNTVFWDENDGASLAYQSTTPQDLAIGYASSFCANGQTSCTGSESFDIFGSVPEPASVTLLALGLTALAAARRRRRA